MDNNVAIILCGGIGSRLKPFTDTTPKPLFKFMNVPIIEYQLRALANDAIGVKTIVLALSRHVFCDSLIHFVKSYCESHQVSVLFSIEDEKLDTGGAIAHAYQTYYNHLSDHKKIDCELNQQRLFFIMNGDIWCDNFYLVEMKQKWHQVSSERLLTNVPAIMIMATKVENMNDFGVMKVYEKSNQVQKFVEKPLQTEPDLNLNVFINAGIYVTNALFALDMIKGANLEKKFSMEKQIFPRMVKTQTLFYYYPERQKWKDLGRPKDHIEALVSWLPNPLIHSFSSIDPTCKIVGAVVVGANTTIGPRCNLKNCIVLENVIVEAGSIINNSIIGDDVHISSETIVDGGDLKQTPKCVVRA